jgi:WD40 repeat protein
MLADACIHYPHVLQHSAAIDAAVKWERVSSKKGVVSVKFDSSGRFCAFLNKDGTLDLWESNAIPRFAFRLQSKMSQAHDAGRADSGTVVWSSDSRRIMTTYRVSGNDQDLWYVCVWDVVSRQQLCNMR